MAKPKPVDQAVYSKNYFLTSCSGFQEFKSTSGNQLEPRLQEIFPRLHLTQNDRLLDIGCGRGEVVIQAARQGIEAVGVDYADAAIDLANQALRVQPKPVKKKAKFMLMNAKALMFPDEHFTVVVLTDVVEHLYDYELNQVMNEINRVLVSRGRLIIHTEPNRIYNNFTYPKYSYPMATLLVELNRLIFRKHYPNLSKPDTLRHDYHKLTHVNEPTYSSLAKLMRHNDFRYRIITKVTILKPQLSWKDAIYNFFVCLDPLSRYFPFNRWFANDFIVEAIKA